jgi:hypothetical protein
MKVVVANFSECWYVSKQVHGVTSHKTVIIMSLGMLMEKADFFPAVTQTPVVHLVARYRVVVIGHR